MNKYSWAGFCSIILMFLVFTVTFLPYKLFAQDPLGLRRRYDSMSRVLQTQSGDDAGFTLLRMSDYWVRQQNGSDSLIIPLSHKAYKLFEQTHNGFGMAWAKFEEGSAFRNMKKPDSALLAFQAAKDIPISDTAKRKNELLGVIWNEISSIYSDKGNLDLSVNISLNKALPYFEKSKNPKRINEVYDGVAVTYLNLKQYDKAAYYYKKSMFAPGVVNIDANDAINFSRLAHCLTKLNQLAEAGAMLDSAYRILKNTPPSYPWAKYYQFKGYWEAKKEFLNSAINDYDIGITIAQKINNQTTVVSILYFKYEALFTQKRFDKAREVAYSIKALSDSLNDTIPMNRASIYKNLWEAEKNTSNSVAALEWLEKYMNVQDTINKRDLDIKINGLVEQYQSEKREKEILELQNQSKLQQLTLSKNRLLVSMLVAGVIILTLLLILFIIISQSRKRIAKQKETLHRQQLIQKEKEHEIKTYNAMLEGQERERSRLSKDLHDGLGGMISGIKMNLQSIGEKNEENSLLLNKTIDQIANAGQELRRIAHNMMPENLIRFGLEFALKDLCEQMQAPHTYVEFYGSDISASILKNEQLTIYRIVQELLNNALKYANASRILVQCIQDRKDMSITVEDNGKGFDTKNISQEHGIGLLNVKNRVQYLRGSVDIDSEQLRGTAINIQIKVHETTEKANIN